MLKKSQNDWLAVDTFFKENEKAIGLKSDIIKLFKSIFTESTARGIHYTLIYYGFMPGGHKTLEEIGSAHADGLTRERVRQIIDHILEIAKKAEMLSNISSKPFHQSFYDFTYLLTKKQKEFLNLKDLIEKDYFSEFKENTKGLIAFLNDARVKQVVYRGENYLYKNDLTREKAVFLIQEENKKVRREKTASKLKSMSKTVTYVPTDVRDGLLKVAEKKNMKFNRLYEHILNEFLNEKPYKDSNDFEKTQSWRARQGKSSWTQIGIFINKNIFDKAQEEAEKMMPEKVATMAFISQAFSWYIKNKK